MCGRFTLTAEPDAIRNEFGLPEIPFDYRPRYNIAPLQDVLVVLQDNNGPRAGWMRWGLVPHWSSEPTQGARMINARSESVTERSAFREAFERRRCLVLADGFYEWQKIGSIKVPMRIRLQDERPFAFAGLWERWSRRGSQPLLTCTILTSEPAPLIAPIHDRMPIMLGPAERELWLQRGAELDELKTLLRPYEGSDLQAYAVTPLVNSVENDTPACVAPADPAVPEQTSLF